LFIKWTKDPWMGRVIAAFIFSFFHFQFFGFFPRFILGILLGALYWYSGSLWPSIIAHTIYNAFTILMIYFNPKLLINPEAGMVDNTNLIWMGLVSASIIGIIIWQMKRHSTTTYAEVYADEDMKPTEKDLTF
ncbi:MAG TPA: CPBP family intramembrane glutamic endopeptidase, partial [Chitinophagaceae bacterium]